MSEAENGGAAFPQHGWSSNPETIARMKDQGGMSLRDYFAAAALPSIVTAMSNSGEFHTWEAAAKTSYALADAMLQARKEGA